MRFVLLAGAAAVLVGSAAAAQVQPSTTTSQFIHLAAQSDAFERQEGRLAATRAVSPRVRTFAQRMVHDHTMTTDQLKAAISRAKLPPPPPPQLSADQQQQLGKLQGLHGSAFDHEYVRQQIAAHKLASQAVAQYANGGDNPVIRAAAAHELPLIRDHLRMAENLEGAH